ncbi:MAG: N-acetylmuramoyl-L-alanine amidase [Clostridia bacterium]|nr:N-acetylmuramoyl-L-alanine amidase [Clostridia bacterium]
MKKIRRIIIIISVLIIVSLAALVGYHYYGLNNPEEETVGVISEDIVRYIMPSDIIEAQPKEKITVTIIAKSEAEITVKLGTQKISAKSDEGAEGYTAFQAEITMPESKLEVDSLGRITVIASHEGKTFQLAGPKIVSGQEMTAEQTSQLLPTAQDGETTKFDIGNYLPEITDDAFRITERLTTTRVYTPTTVYEYTPYTGNQMCVVTAAYADTKPIADHDDLVPYYTPLAAGTMDYVTGESSGYNVDEDETEYYYNLQSGRKIKREAVQIIQKTDMGNNSLSVLSSVCDGGELKITLSSAWKVPYDLNYTPQEYYHGYRKNYNVTSFTASLIEFTFHYTDSAYGTIDTSGSDVVSSAYWSVDEENKIAKLIMPLKAQGGYYGSSLEYDANGNTVITINRKPVGAYGAVVILDAGHGGSDPGAAGLNDQVRECDVNLLVTYAAMEELQKQGVTVYLTRYGDEKMLLEERKAVTRSVKPDLFVSVHSNGSENPESKGTSTYYFKPFSFSLATNIYNELLSVHRNNFYYGRQELYNELADAVQNYPFGVTRIEDCPSVLIEIGYVTNDEECYKLIDTNNQKLLGKAIADGIIRTLQG